MLTNSYVGRMLDGKRSYQPESAAFFAEAAKAGARCAQEEFVAHGRWQGWVGDSNDAIETLEQARKFWPREWMAHVAEAEILVRCEMPNDAFDAAMWAVQLGPSRWESWNVKASVHRARGEEELASKERARAEDIWRLRHPRGQL